MICAATLCGISNTIGADVTVTLITDPNISPIRVGESMSPMLVAILDKYIRVFNEQNSLSIFQELHMMPRVGARHTWEDNVNPGYDVNYKHYAAHFDSSCFITFVRRRLKELYGHIYNEIDDNIKSITQNELVATVQGKSSKYYFSFVFDCRGFPTLEEYSCDEYNFPAFETVNSLLVFQHLKPYTHTYTDNRIHRNGWQFGINTSDRKAFGYLYNKDITSKEDAVKHYLSLNKDIPINEADIKSLSWKFYSAKKPVDNRIIKMGNKLYFYEPIQGIPLHYYAIFSNMSMDYMMCKDTGFNWDFRGLLGSYLIKSDSFTPEDAMNEFHTVTMDRYFEIICSNYVGNTMDSEFWRITKRKSLEKLIYSEPFMEFARQVVDFQDGKDSEYPDFYIHKGTIICQYMNGLQVDFKEIVNTDPQSLLNKYS